MCLHTRIKLEDIRYDLFYLSILFMHWQDLYLASLSPCCRVCGAQLMLLVQVYCPLIGSTYHRTLYVYCCTRRSCWPDTDRYIVCVTVCVCVCVCVLLMGTYSIVHVDFH